MTCQSVRQRHMQVPRPPQLCRCKLGTGPTWALGSGLWAALDAASNRAAHAALKLPHTGKVQLGAGFRALARQPGSCWMGPLKCQPACTNSGAGAGELSPHRSLPASCQVY